MTNICASVCLAVKSCSLDEVFALLPFLTPGYIRMVSELVVDGVVPYDIVVVSVGSAGTLAGLLAGRMLLGVKFAIWGVCACDNNEFFRCSRNT